MWFECLLISWWPLKRYFRLTLQITIHTHNALSCIHQLCIFLWYKIRFVTTLAFKFCLFWLVFVSRLLFYDNWLRLVTIFVRSLGIKRNFWLSRKIVLNWIDFAWLTKVIAGLRGVNFFILAFVTWLKNLRIIVFLLGFGHFVVNRFLEGKRLVKGFVGRLGLKF